MERRQFIMGVGSSLLSFFLAGCGFTSSISGREKASPPLVTNTDQKKNILIAYFSRTGNTREIAYQIQQNTRGNLWQISTAEAYPADYNATVEQAKREQAANYRPKLAATLPDLASYHVIFLGYPNWWRTMPMALFTFLENLDFSQKTIIPFCTHDGGRMGRSVSDIRALCPQAAILEGFECRGSNVKNAQEAVGVWLRQIGMKLT